MKLVSYLPVDGAVDQVSETDLVNNSILILLHLNDVIGLLSLGCCGLYCSKLCFVQIYHSFVHRECDQDWAGIEDNGTFVCTT